MRKFILLLSIAAAGVVAVGMLLAQGRNRISPHEQTSATFDGKKVTIEYGRPYKKGREIFGGLVPWDKVWRTGADEATILTSDADLMIVSMHVPKGSYSLFTIPEKQSWTLIVNKVAKQWGAFKYEESQDLGRIKMTVSEGPDIEQFTIGINNACGNRGSITMKWDKPIATIPVMVH